MPYPIPKSLLPIAAIFSLGLAGCQNMNKTGEGSTDTASAEAQQALDEAAKENLKAANKSELVAHLKGTKLRSQVNGHLNLSPTDEGLTITGEIKGLKPNTKHGFHVHQYGDCSAEDATSAGGHYNPDNMPHNLPEEQKRHAGDLGNIESDSKGIAQIEIDADRLVPLYGKYPVAGRALVVHAQPDTGQGESGEAGARIACGVIGFTETE